MSISSLLQDELAFSLKTVIQSHSRAKGGGKMAGRMCFESSSPTLRWTMKSFWINPSLLHSEEQLTPSQPIELEFKLKLHDWEHSYGILPSHTNSISIAWIEWQWKKTKCIRRHPGKLYIQFMELIIADAILYACTNEEVILYELWKWENLSMESGESLDV